MGVVFVTVNIIFVPMRGVTNVLSAVIVGQLCLAVYFDHIGFLGIDIKPAYVYRVVGVFVLLLGLRLIQYGPQLFGKDP